MHQHTKSSRISPYNFDRSLSYMCGSLKGHPLTLVSSLWLYASSSWLPPSSLPQRGHCIHNPFCHREVLLCGPSPPSPVICLDFPHHMPQNCPLIFLPSVSSLRVISSAPVALQPVIFLYVVPILCCSPPLRPLSWRKTQVSVVQPSPFPFCVSSDLSPHLLLLLSHMWPSPLLHLISCPCSLKLLYFLHQVSSFHSPTLFHTPASTFSVPAVITQRHNIHLDCNVMSREAAKHGRGCCPVIAKTCYSVSL